MKTTDDILQNFRKIFTYAFTETDFLNAYGTKQLIFSDMEQFIKEALERSYKQGEIDALSKFTKAELTKYNRIKQREHRDKLKANKEEATQTTALAITKKCPLHQCLNCGVISKPSE